MGLLERGSRTLLAFSAPSTIHLPLLFFVAAPGDLAVVSVTAMMHEYDPPRESLGPRASRFVFGAWRLWRARKTSVFP